MADSIRVQIIQPAIPAYRKPLFEALCRDERFSILLSSSKTEPLGVKSVSLHCRNVDRSHRTLSFLGRRVFWQKGLFLDSSMNPGDVLVVNGNPRYLSTLYLIARAKLCKLTIVWWGHGWSSTTRFWTFRLRLQVMKLADYYLFYTHREKEMMISSVGGIDPSRIFYMNNTVNTTAIRDVSSRVSQKQIVEFRKNHKLDGRQILLFVGRLRAVPPTELRVAIGAVAQLNRLRERFVLVVVGDGSDWSELEDYVKVVGTESSVFFCGAIYSEEQLAPWFLSADLFVYPGPIGLSLLHAFSYGLPVITHDMTLKHGPEIAALKNGVNGLVFRRGDPRDLADKIEEGMKRLSVLKDGALRTIEDEYSFPAMVERIKECIVSAHAFRASGKTASQ